MAWLTNVPLVTSFLLEDSHEQNAVRVKSSSMEPAGPRRSSPCSLGLPRGGLHEMAFATISLKKHSLCPSKKANRWSDENERVPGEPLFQRVLLRWPKRGPQPSLHPHPYPSHESHAAKPQSHTKWHGWKEEPQIPESFFRQSVPIKVRVTVGKLKQK